jgi:hypothetical protein
MSKGARADLTHCGASHRAVDVRPNLRIKLHPSRPAAKMRHGSATSGMAGMMRSTLMVC